MTIYNSYVANDTPALIAVPPGGGTTVSLSLGFWTYLGIGWYMLGTVEIPATNSDYDYQVLFSFMKVY